MNKEFNDFKNQQPKELQEMIEKFNLRSFEDLLGFATLIGIDVNKIFDYADKRSTDELPELDKITFDNDNPMRAVSDNFKEQLFAISGGDEDEDWSDDEEGDGEFDASDMDPFELPEVLLIGDNAKEYHLRIRLEKAPVPIWREVKVPSNITMEALAFVIMDAMGWSNTHLHCFAKKGIEYKNTCCILQDRALTGMFGVRNMTCDSNNVTLGEVLTDPKEKMKFEYDFGDGWMHEVTLKAIGEYSDDNVPGFYIVKGKGMCPPEDCGGVWGYEELLALLAKKRRTKDEREQLNWYGIDNDYDACFFDIEDAQGALDDLWDCR